MKEVQPPVEQVTYFFNGTAGEAYAGANVAAAILQNGNRILRTTRETNKPRGIFCGIGVCFDCLVVINGIANQRACLVEICDGMRIETQIGSGAYFTEERS